MQSPLTVWAEAEKSRNRPVVACIATEEVEKSCAVNGLTFEQLLSPFARCHPGARLPFRSSSSTIVLKNFALRLVKAADVGPAPSPTASNSVLEAAANLLPEEADSMIDDCPRIQDTYDVPGAFEKHAVDQQPWYVRYRSELEQSMRWREQTMLEYPAVILLVASTMEASGDPAASFEDLQHPRYLPHPFQNGHFDPSAVSYHFLLLHDQCKAAAAGIDANSIISRAKRACPPQQLSIVSINGLPPLSPNTTQPDIWLPYCGVANKGASNLRDFLSPSLGGEVHQQYLVRGCFLTPENLQELAVFGQELVSGLVIRSMERRISGLNTVVSTMQNRVKNLVKSWWRKPQHGNVGDNDSRRGSSGSASDHSGSAGIVLYKHDKIESQIRLLADSAFIMQDFDLAYTMYRMAAGYYKGDRSLSHYAWATMGAALSASLASAGEGERGRRRDIVSNFGYAADAIERKGNEDRNVALRNSGGTKVIPHSTRIGTYFAIRRADAMSVRGLDYEAAERLLSASKHESSLTAAILLEKAAWHFLKSRNLRKFAMLMVLAGQTYRSSQRRVHCVRCYVCALGLYGGSGWSAIQAHVHSSLASDLAILGRRKCALLFYARLLVELEGLEQSPVIESHYVSSFLDLCASDPRAASAAGLSWAKQSSRSRISICRDEESLDPKESETARDKILFPELPIPKVMDQHLEVLEGDASINALQSVDYIKIASMRESLESELNAIKAVQRGDGPWLDVTVSLSYKMQREETSIERQRRLACPTAKQRAVMEPILVKVDLENPLTVPLTLTDVQLKANLRNAHRPELVVLRSNSADTPENSENFEAVHLGQGRSFEDDVSFVTQMKNASVALIAEAISCTLPPRSKKSIELRVCPTRCGLLHIRGLEWRLAVQSRDPGSLKVMGLHSFDLRGPLLQHTLEHRAMRMRAPPAILHSAIVGAMPCLRCHITGMPSNLLEGEIVRTELIIENIGHAEASGIIIKTNFPCISISCDEITPGIAQGDPLGGTIGASATLLDPKIGTISPGGSKTVALWVKGMHIGQQSLIMLVRYRRSDCTREDGASGPCFERYAPLASSLSVLPSLSVSALVLPSYSCRGEYIMRMEIGNIMKGAMSPGTVQVKKILVVSQQWGLIPEFSGANSLPKFCDWRERISLHFRLIPKAGKTDVTSMDTGSFFSTLRDDSGDPIESSDPASTQGFPHAHFICLEQAAAKLAAADERFKQQLAAEEAAASDDQPMTIQAIRRQNERNRTLEILKQEEQERKRQWDDEHYPHPASLAALCPPHSSVLSIIVVWTAPGGDGKVHWGQHHIRNIVVRPHTTEKQCPLILTAKYPHVLHDGDEANVDVCVTNRLVGKESSLDFLFETRMLTDAYSWRGTTKKAVSALGPGQSVTISLRAVFMKPGIHDLNCFRFTVGSTAYAFASQYLIDVKGAGNLSK